MSEALNEIHAYFGKLNTTTTRKVSQWAYGQKLIIHDPELPPVFEAYYSNSRSRGTADPQIGTNGVVDAPHAYFRSGADIYVFLMVHEGQDDGRYKKIVHIPIDPCAEPSDVEPEPYEQGVIDQAIAALNAAVAQCGAYVEHYPTVIDGEWYVWDEASKQFVTTDVPATGNGIADARLNNDYTLTLIFTDGTSFTTPISIRGATGPQGVQGPQGEQGPAPTDAQVQSAVDEWYEEHPEGIVPDGSLTEAKFTSATQLKVVNDYVTPEMFGAVGDGVTDDTASVQEAFDSGRNVLLSKKTYLVSGIDITHNIKIYSDEASVIAKDNYQEYIFKATARIYLDGGLFLDGKNKALNGFVFESAYSSVIDRITVENMRIWGVYLYNSGGVSFRSIRNVYCGTSMGMTVSRGSTAYELTIDSTLPELYQVLLNSSYWKYLFLIDDSGYSNQEQLVGGNKLAKRISEYDEEYQKFILQAPSHNSIPADYISKNCYVCIGGGICIGDGCNTQINIGYIDTRMSATGVTFYATYGHVIDSIYSQADRIPLAYMNYCQGGIINSITAEGPISGFVILNYYYNYTVIGARSTGYNEEYTSQEVAGIVARTREELPIQVKTTLRRTLTVMRTSASLDWFNEETPDNIILFNQSSIKFSLRDNPYYGHDQNVYNLFGFKRLYFMSTSAQTSDITITLHNDLISSGYTIKNGTDGVLTFERPSMYFVAMVYLYQKQFIVFIEPLSVANDPTTLVNDVQINGQSILNDGVANIPIAANNVWGVTAPNSDRGLQMVAGKIGVINPADGTVRLGTSNFAPLTIGHQHQGAFYGLAKAAGDNTQASSSNAVGDYTNNAIDKIISMLGIDDLIAPHENTQASQPYAIGGVFIYNGKLYKATSAIAEGENIQPDTNCVQTTLIDIITA